MTNWKNLNETDFQIANADWLPSLEATVRVSRSDVSLNIDGTLEARPEHACRFMELLRGWNDHLDDIAQQTQDYLQTFLPGKKIRRSEITLWGVTLFTDEGKPTSGCFFYHVAGEYDSPQYKLDQFDHRSVVELSCPLIGDAIDWTARDVSATNDFD